MQPRSTATHTAAAALSTFMLGNFLNEFAWTCFSPIYATVSKAFNVSSFCASLLPLTFLLLFPPASLIAAFLLARSGTRFLVLSGSAAQACGSWLRFAACALAAWAPSPLSPQALHACFALLLLGQASIACAQPVFTNLPARLSATWFSARLRPLATTAATLSNPIGNALGSALPALLLPAPGAGPDSGRAAAAGLAWLCLAQALAATAQALAVQLFLAEQPLAPPSAAEALRRGLRGEGLQRPPPPALCEVEEVAEPLLAPLSTAVPATPPTPWAAMRADYGTLLADRAFWPLLGGFGLALGAFNAIFSLLGQLLSPCGYSAGFAGLLGGSMLGVGLLSSMGMGVVLLRTRALVPALKLLFCGAGVGTLLLLGSLQRGGGAQLLGVAVALGACAVPLLPIALETAAESFFPVGEDASSALLTMAGKGLGAVFLFSLQPLVAAGDCSTVVTPAAGLLVAVLACASIGVLTFQTDYRRGRAEAAVVELHK